MTGTRVRLRRFLTLGTVVIAGLAAAPPPAHGQTVADGFVPYSGTSEISSVLPDEHVPARLRSAIDTYQSTARWAVADPTHFRIDIYVRKPALQSQHEVFAAAGTSAVWYQSIFNRAFQLPIVGNSALGTLGLMRGGSLAAALESAPSIADYARMTGTQVRVLKTAMMLGRQVEVLDLRPLSGSSSCDSSGGCAHRDQGYARVWFDPSLWLVLRLEMHDLPPSQSPQHWVYRVTSLELAPPPASAVGYQPPVVPVPPPNESGGTETMSGGGTAVQVPEGFIPIHAPSGFTVWGSGTASDPMWTGPSQVSAWLRGRGALFIQEQVRVGGLPHQLISGATRVAGSCKVWTGTWSGRLHWLAAARGTISLLAVATRLSRARLIGWAAATLCPRRS